MKKETEISKLLERVNEALKSDQNLHQSIINDIYYLGQLYSEDRDYAKAVYWWEKAAINGDKYSQYNLAACLYNGWGIEQNYEKAFYWFSVAADKGNYSAQKMLVKCYSYGIGVEKNREKALYWRERKEENGFPRDQCALGCLFYRKNNIGKSYLLDQESRRKRFCTSAIQIGGNLFYGRGRRTKLQRRDFIVL